MTKKNKTHGFARAAFIAALGLGAASLAGPAFAVPMTDGATVTSGNYKIVFHTAGITGSFYTGWQMVAATNGFKIVSQTSGAPLLSVVSGAGEDQTLDFTVSAVSGSLSTDILGIEATGNASVTEQTGIATATARTTSPTATLNFAAATSVDITKDISVANPLSGGNSGEIDSISQTFAVPTPEPAGIAVLGVGLLGLAMVLRRRRVQ